MRREGRIARWCSGCRARRRTRAALDASAGGAVDVRRRRRRRQIVARAIAALKARQRRAAARSRRTACAGRAAHAELGIKSLKRRGPSHAIPPARTEAALRDGDADPLGRHGRDGPRQQRAYFRYFETVASTGCAASARCRGPTASGLIVNAFCSFIRQLESGRGAGQALCRPGAPASTPT